LRRSTRMTLRHRPDLGGSWAQPFWTVAGGLRLHVIRLIRRRVPDYLSASADRNFAVKDGVFTAMAKGIHSAHSNTALAKRMLSRLPSQRVVIPALTLNPDPSDKTAMLPPMLDELAPLASKPGYHPASVAASLSSACTKWYNSSHMQDECSDSGSEWQQFTDCLFFFSASCGSGSGRRPSEDWISFSRVRHFGARKSAARRFTECPLPNPKSRSCRNRNARFSFRLSQSHLATGTATTSTATAKRVASCA
jgi:hypothetical protein